MAMMMKERISEVVKEERLVDGIDARSDVKSIAIKAWCGVV
jgi:hypothetical protein